MSVFEVSYLVLWLVVIVLLAGTAALYTAVGAGYQMQSAAAISEQGPIIGNPVELWRLRELSDDLIDTSTQRWIFASPECHLCADLKVALLHIDRDSLPGSTAMVCGGDHDDVLRWISDVPSWISVVPDEQGEIFRMFNVSVMPFYVGLDAGGRCVTKGLLSDLNGLLHYEELLADPSASLVGA